MPAVEGAPQIIYLGLLPLVAGLGYGDFTTTRSPAEKSRLSSLYLGLYSLVLLALAVLAGHNRAVAFLAAVFSPLGHEAVIALGKWMELKGKPLYVPTDEGMRLLDVLPGGPAWQAGLRPGDVIVAVNGVKFADRTEFYSLLQSSFLPPSVDYISLSAGAAKNTVIKLPEPGQAWGVAPVPESNEDRYVELLTVGPLGRWIMKLWGKNAR
jgi:membrane-associated protease RseP (regulator of RpoE activity)